MLPFGKLLTVSFNIRKTKQNKRYTSAYLCAQSCLTLRPHGLQPARLLCPWDYLGKNTGVGCHFLLQRIFLTQGSNPHLLHWQVDSLPPSHLVLLPFKRYPLFLPALHMGTKLPICQGLYLKYSPKIPLPNRRDSV